MKTIILCLLMLTTISCASTDKWSKEDLVMATAMTTVITVDWGQTRYIAKDPYRGECNPYLGKNPSIGQIDTYFPAIALLSLTLADILPSEYRSKLLYAFTLTEITTIRRNHFVGVKVKF